MKIKMDFVTNSSSTCFFLEYHISLREKACKIDIETIKKNFENIVNKYKILDEKPEVHCYSSSCYLNNFVFLKDENFEEDRSENHPKVTIAIEQGQIYDDKTDDTKDSVLMDITAKTGLLNSDPKSLYIDKLIEIMNECLKNVSGNLELFFSQTPVDICGDGWNTGDPMGEYTTIYELLTKQTKIGKILRVKNEWKTYMKK